MNADGAVRKAVDEILPLARRYRVRDAAYDPWRFRSEATRLERDHGSRTVEFPQSHRAIAS